MLKIDVSSERNFKKDVLKNRKHWHIALYCLASKHRRTMPSIHIGKLLKESKNSNYNSQYYNKSQVIKGMAKMEYYLF